MQIPPIRQRFTREELRSGIRYAVAAREGRHVDRIADVLVAAVGVEQGRLTGAYHWNVGNVTTAGASGNWYALQHRDPSEDVLRYKAYGSLADGTEGMVGLIFRKWPEAIEAAAAGDLDGFARALYGYYVGDTSKPLHERIGAYARRLRDFYQPTGGGKVGAAGAVLLVVGAGVLVVWLVRRYTA